ncbi:ATP-binding protein [Geodermatophilus sp. CPCC 205506]|uniref:ATP-binding protein n=1 Tax=Geodermatophilus sp. CPCC 205506 TaxID=2936596 RepID=UPI003EEAE45A
MTTTGTQPAETIRTPDQRIRVFVSSTLGELAEERRVVRAAIERLHLAPVMFELGARPHPPRELYRAYLRQSHVFLGIYHQRYGWVAPGEAISGLEDEFRLSEGMPRLLYLKRPAAAIEPRLQAMLDAVSAQGSASYRQFTDSTELAALVEDDLAALLSERFMAQSPGAATFSSRELARPVPAPVPLTATVGRDADIAAVAELLGQDVRLVTVTGPGGVGKTRLALEVARAVAGRFADGVAFVPLEDVPGPELVLPALAAALRLPEAGTRPLLDRLVDELTGRQLLVVADNMEHLRAAGPDLTGLLGRCPRLALLVTSRQTLRLRGEHEYPLPPLPVPNDDQVTGDGAVDDVPAVSLFVQRAADVRPGFALTEDNRAAVTAIVRLLDGLPLAIELAAARSRLFPPTALAGRLAQRLDVLAGGAAGDLPARQRTLRATLDWSCQLLTPAEQALFARLSVFAGGATLGAVDAVCGDDTVSDVLDGVSSLLEKNLLFADAADEPRVGMLHVVRAYATDLLNERNEAERLSDRHALFYADLIEPADIIAHNDAPGSWPLLTREADNLLAAARWVATRGDIGVLAALARRLWPWLIYTGRVGELRDVVPAAVDAAADSREEDPGAREQAFLHHLALCYAQTQTGDHAAALASAERALTLAADTVDRETALLAAAVRLLRGALRLSLGETAGVADDLDSALDTARREDNAWLLGHATLHRGVWRALTGNTAGARADLEEAAGVATEMGHDVLLAQAVGHLATLDLLAGDLEESLSRLRSQIEHLRRARNLEGLATALDTTAALASQQQRWETAARAAAAADALRERVGLPARPVTRDLHDAAVDATLQRLGDRAPAIRAAASEADPWVLVDDVLAQLAGAPYASRGH